VFNVWTGAPLKLRRYTAYEPCAEILSSSNGSRAKPRDLNPIPGLNGPPAHLRHLFRYMLIAEFLHRKVLEPREQSIEWSLLIASAQNSGDAVWCVSI